MAKVSVIIPVYNVEKYLKKCVMSVTAQTEKDIEIILVNDGSTDNSGKLCDELSSSDGRVKVIHKKNGGLSDARNFGLDAASSEYILFIDSDDYIEPETIELSLNKAESDNSDIVMFDIQLVTEDGNVIDYIKTNKSVSAALAKDPSIILTTPSACNKLFKASLFDGVKFPLHAWYEDLRTIPKLYDKCNNISFVDSKPLYNYLVRENSITHNGDAAKTSEQRILASNDFVEYFKSNGLYDKYKAEIDWTLIYHGFVLPCRELMNFKNNAKPAMDKLRTNLISALSIDEIKGNKYFSTLTKIEKLIFDFSIKKQYGALITMVKVKNLIK